MKKWLILTGIVVLLFVGGYFSLSFYAVKFIQARLQKGVRPGLTLAEIKGKPTYLSVKGIRYEDPHSKRTLLNVEEMRVYPSLLSSLRGLPEIREWTIVKPSLFFDRSNEGVFVGPWMDLRKEREIPDDTGRKEGKPVPRIRVDRLRIENGSVDFEDRKTEEPPAHIGLKALDLEIKDIQYPITSVRSPVELKGKLKGVTKDGSIHAKGWIDLETTDMEIYLSARGVELKTFEPYYRKRVSAEIEAGTINMEAKVSVKKKMIDAPGYLELNDLRIKEGEGTILWIPARTLVSLLENRDQIKVKFHIQGNTEDPQFNLQERFLNRMIISVAEALGIPITVVGEKVFGGTIKGAEGLVEGLKSIEELFRKKKEKKR